MNKNNKLYTLILATLIAATPVQSEAFFGDVWNWFSQQRTDKKITLTLAATGAFCFAAHKILNWYSTKKITTPLKKLNKQVTKKTAPVRQETQPRFWQRFLSLIGINNSENNCYLNSVFQALFHTPTFVDDFYYTLKDNPLIKTNSEINTLHTTLKNTVLADKAIDANQYHNAIKQALNLNKYEIDKQQDAQQALAVILNKTEELFKQVKSNKSLTIAYQEKSYNDKQPETSNTVTAKTHHLILKIDKEKINTVQDALNDYFSEETIEEHKKYNKKKFKIQQLPNTLVCVLGRYAYDKTLTKLTKLKKAITFGDTVQFNDQTYKLSSIVVHHGQTLNSGHYTTCTKTHEFDDETVKKSNEFDVYAKKGIINSTIENKRIYDCSTPYILCYSLKK